MLAELLYVPRDTRVIGVAGYDYPVLYNVDPPT